MAQFDIHRNQHLKGKSRTPYLLDVQHSTMASLGTRLVVPVRLRETHSDMVLKRLHFHVSVGEEPCIAFVSEMAAVPVGVLGDVVDYAGDQRTEIIAAIDLLITGF